MSPVPGLAPSCFLPPPPPRHSHVGMSRACPRPHPLGPDTPALLCLGFYSLVWLLPLVQLGDLFPQSPGQQGGARDRATALGTLLSLGVEKNLGLHPHPGLCSWDWLLPFSGTLPGASAPRTPAITAPSPCLTPCPSCPSGSPWPLTASLLLCETLRGPQEAQRKLTPGAWPPSPWEPQFPALLCHQPQQPLPVSLQLIPDPAMAQALGSPATQPLDHKSEVSPCPRPALPLQPGFGHRTSSGGLASSGVPSPGPCRLLLLNLGFLLVPDPRPSVFSPTRALVHPWLQHSHLPGLLAMCDPARLSSLSQSPAFLLPGSCLLLSFTPFIHLFIHSLTHSSFAMGRDCVKC